ncbi:MAG TPA: hypothetical protein VN047_05780 [Sphingopyxis sp.]|uniref:hypothetical protein n=1 Tax=Sphingopyxis sp. TaxID=1908224 RepID=UPI002C27C439|nr:hypothetical protein [Sphingopyxis sp.]HWW56381.1 hypothetical protein [Sphingopyxis sp.]
MAAVDKAPRIVRDTTNMEEAAKLAAMRQSEAANHNFSIVRKVLGNAEPTFTNVLRVVHDLDEAWNVWAGPFPNESEPTGAEGAPYQAGYEAIGDARWRANCILRATPAISVPEIVAKADYILSEVLDGTDDPYLVEGIQSLLRDMTNIVTRPDGDAFAILLRNWERSWKDRDDFDAANRPKGVSGICPEIEAWEDGRAPYNDATEVAALALLRCPAPDIAALNEKRRVFLAEEMHTCAYASSDLVELLFEEAIRLAGGVA